MELKCCIGNILLHVLAMSDLCMDTHCDDSNWCFWCDERACGDAQVGR